MHLHHAYGNNAYPVIPAGQVLPADEYSPQPSNPSHLYQVSHSHDVSLHGVWTKGIPSPHGSIVQ